MLSFNTYLAVERFLDVEEEIRAVTDLRDAPLENRSSITWLAVTAPLRAILALFLCALAPLLDLFGQTSWARDAEIMGRFCFLEIGLVAKMLTYGEDLLSPLFSTYAFSARAIYSRRSISTEELRRDPALFETVRDWERIDFYQPDGVCRGIAIFFSLLYLQTQHLFPQDPARHLQVIASLLAHGATAKPALFQALCYTDHLAKVARREILDLPDELENGVYEIWLPRHRIVYIKVSADQSFLVDPGVGVIALHGEEPPAERGRIFKLMRSE